MSIYSPRRLNHLPESERRKVRAELLNVDRLLTDITRLLPNRLGPMTMKIRHEKIEQRAKLRDYLRLK